MRQADKTTRTHFLLTKALCTRVGFFLFAILGVLNMAHPQANQTVVNGASTAPVTFSGTGCVYNWVNNTPGIGLAASGTGNIPSFVAVNNGNTPVTATITATPVAAGFAYIGNRANGSIAVINTASNAIVNTIALPSPNPYGVAVSPDGSTIYVTDDVDGLVSVMQAATGKLLASITVGQEPNGLALSPDGSTLYVANGAGTVSVINTANNAITASIPSYSGFYGITANPNGKQVYVTNQATNAVYVINPANNNITASIAVGVQPDGLCASPDGSLLYVTNAASNTVSVVNTKSNAVLSTIPVGPSPVAVCISPDGSHIYVANSGNGTVSVINTATNAVVATPAVGANPAGVSITPDGAEVYVVNAGSGNVSVVNTATNTVKTTVSIPGGSQPFSFGSFVTGGVNCQPVTFTITVNPSGPTITDGSASGSISACSGTASASPNIQQFTVVGTGLTANITTTAPAGFEVSLASGSGYGGTVTLPQTGGVVNSTVVYARSAASAPAGNISGNVTLASPGATSQNVAVSGVVTALATPSVSITSSTNNICAGTPVTFTATPTNGGTTPAYQWQVNGANAGTNSASFATNTLNNGDVVSCVLTSNAACATSPSATSNSIKMAVAANVTPSVSITSSLTNICSGTSVVFTATATNGGTTPAYQWLVNGNNAGTNNTVFITSGLNNGDVVSCVLTSSAACATAPTATSNAIAITVLPTVTPSVSISASPDSICPGGTVTFTAVAVNGGNPPNYRWLLNGSPVGTNSPTYTNATLNNGDLVKCVVASTAACLTTVTAPSNSITIFVAANVAPAVSIAATASNICKGAQATFTATPTNGGAMPAYQWLLNGGNAGTNSPTFTTSALNNGDVVSCVLTSNAACALPPTATSNTITMAVVGQLTPSVSIMASANNICSGTAVTFTATATGAGGTPLYQWKLNGANTGTNGPTYTNANPANGDMVSCVITSSAACSTSPTATSNTIAMNVTKQVTPSVVIAASADSICAGMPVTFTATSTNGGAAPTYQWLLNGLGVGANSASYTNNTLNNGDVVSCFVTSNAACVTPDTATSNGIAMGVTQLATSAVSISASADSICAGTQVTFTATPANGGSAPAYEWVVNNTNTSNNGSFASGSLQNGDSVYCILTGSQLCAVPDTSAPIYMVVYPVPTIAFNPDTVYITGANGIQLAPQITGTIEHYQWSPNLALNPTDTVAAPIANPSSIAVYQLQVTALYGCSATDSVTVITGLPVMMPSAFTPNGDGRNDVFRIPPGVQLNLQEMDIFDRWGNRVFVSKDAGTGWDGSFNGNPLPPGAYIYMVRGTTTMGQPVFLKGTVVLIR